MFFLAWTFWPRNRSSSGRHVWLRDRGKPRREEGLGAGATPGAQPSELPRLRNGKTKGSWLKCKFSVISARKQECV